jgi:endonuclease/exonuclease/phosphatase family metal-dependent hydrolase
MHHVHMATLSQRYASEPAGTRRALVRIMSLALVMGFALSSGPARADHTPRQISIITLNLWHDKADWPSRQAHIVTTLRALRPDVIALQEVLENEDLPNQARTLADALGYRSFFVSVDAPAAKRRFGNAILTRHRVLAEDWKALLPLDDYRTVAHQRIAISGAAIDIYVTHLHYKPDGGAIRRTQVEDLVAYLHATSGTGPGIVVGDFNTPANAPELAPLTATHADAYDRCHPTAAQNAAEHSTLNLAWYAPLRIDHVFFDPRKLEVIRARRLFTEPYAAGQWASDHYGIETVLQLHRERGDTPQACD